MHGLLTVEVVPADQREVPIPAEGDVVEVFGTWVLDSGHFPGDSGWNEIHPVVYLRNLTTGVEGGSPECKMLAGVHDPERLLVLDSVDPCKWARGSVKFVFTFSDGDIHVDLLLDQQYQYLAKSSPPLLAVSYPFAVLLTLSSILTFGLPYGVVSAVWPRRTLAGRLVLRLLGK